MTQIQKLFSITKMYNTIKMLSLTHQQIPLLGRWTIDYREAIIKRKVDLANDDHCGPCGDEVNDKKSMVEYGSYKHSSAK